MLISQQGFFYNRFRAKHEKPVRLFLDMRYGLPEGYRDPNSTFDIENRCAQQAAALRNAGYNIEIAAGPPWIEWGYDPQMAYQLSGQAVPDPATFTPAPDMESVAPKAPFSLWGYRPQPEVNSDANSIENNGVGFLYPPNPDDKLDIGAHWGGAIALPNGGATITGVWEKVIWRVANSRPVAWERIA